MFLPLLPLCLLIQKCSFCAIVNADVELPVDTNMSDFADLSVDADVLSVEDVYVDACLSSDADLPADADVSSEFRCDSCCRSMQCLFTVVDDVQPPVVPS
jgi:hypothetical protein